LTILPIIAADALALEYVAGRFLGNRGSVATEQGRSSAIDWLVRRRGNSLPGNPPRRRRSSIRRLSARAWRRIHCCGSLLGGRRRNLASKVGLLVETGCGL